MPYHVEVRAARRHARLFNLDAAELQRRIVGPWQLGGPVLVGDRRWERRESQLRILDGPELASIELAYGRGWSAAERSARDVTAVVLGAGVASAVAVLAADEESLRAAEWALRRLALRSAEWSEVRGRILRWLAEPEAAGDLGVSAVLAICAAGAPSPWLLDAGLAIGALGRRTVLATSGAEVPDVLDGFETLALHGESENQLAALATRLRQAGCALSGT
jgi:hypothetical protein